MLIGGVRGVVWLAWDELGSERSVGRKHAMEANEMEPGSRNKSSQTLRELQRRHHEMSGPIAIRRFELKDDLGGA